MIKLANGATVHAAVIFPGDIMVKPNGFVLAENERNWICWNIHWDGGTTGDDEGQTHEVWESTGGVYFHKERRAEEGDARQLAEFQFGLMIRRQFNDNTVRGAQVIDSWGLIK